MNTTLVVNPKGGAGKTTIAINLASHFAAVNLGTPDYQGSRHYGSNVAGTAQIVRWFLRLASVGGQDGAQRV